MDVKIDIKELRKRKIFIASPMYGGMCSGIYTKASVDLARLASQYGMDINFYYLFNESLITRARNYCVDEFLRSDFTHLMFIDSDIGFNPNDVLALAALAEPGSDKHIMCGPYPKKTIAWEKIKKAVDKGFGDDNPQALQKYVGDYVFNPAEGVGEIQLDQPVEVLEGGTGFMMIPRETFTKFAEAYPDNAYYPDHVRSDHFDGTRMIHMYFQALIEKRSDGQPRYLSEDYMFCQWARKAGLKTWMCPWMKLVHMGSYNFGGSLIDLAQVGASATADPNEKLKNK